MLARSRLEGRHIERRHGVHRAEFIDKSQQGHDGQKSRLVGQVVVVVNGAAGWVGAQQALFGSIQSYQVGM
jgi:hypothetical protein